MYHIRLQGILILIFILLNTTITAQFRKADSAELLRKTIVAGRINSQCKIDGYLDETFWKSLPVASDFVQYSPRNRYYPSYKTEVRFGYDDDALYIGAIMFDPHPDSLYTELGKRDQLEELAVDYISFDILPYNDGLNMYEFKVSPSGLQHDCKYSAVGQDITWDAVWQSTTRIGDSAWYAEVRLPYSALRFPKTEKQVWGINMWRCIRRNNEWSTWSFVDNTVNDIFKYYGDLTGIENIDPPFRLNITPYIASYLNSDPEHSGWSKSVRGGVDLRWGLNESYTLDMMLIPDFGQIQTDDKILNLSPFEVRYDEKRQFFTEGTELFDKGGILYSRRIGGLPRNYDIVSASLGANESIISNPDETRIINATKISGRNRKGLGAGFFNAMTAPVYAEISIDSNNNTRKILTQPFTNYNVLVLDQNLKNNSYISLINTNLISPQDGYMANVTGLEENIMNASRTLEVYSVLNVSNTEENNGTRITGHQLTAHIFKPSGNFQYQILHTHADKQYDPNDMGYLEVNNYSNNSVSLWYNFYEPRSFYNSQIFKVWTFYNTLFDQKSRKNSGFGVASKTTFKNFQYAYISFISCPWGSNDYNEPRVEGRFYHAPATNDLVLLFSTDLRKAFTITFSEEIVGNPALSNPANYLSASPRYRFTDHFSMSYEITLNTLKNNFGWVNTVPTEYAQPNIYFGRRNVQTVNSILSGKYIFSTKLMATLRLRHYWSAVKYLDFQRLLQDGSLEESTYSGEHNVNFNTFSSDIQLIWYFAPGSELSVVWKDAITTLDESIALNYFRNLGNTFEQPMARSISVRVLYYLDYNEIKRKLSAKRS